MAACPASRLCRMVARAAPAVWAIVWLIVLVALAPAGTAGATPPGDRIATLIARENARAGTADWQLHDPAVAGEIQGYASRTSVGPGETIEFFVDTEAEAYRLEIFRIGYYGGLGARRLLAIDHLPGLRQSKPCIRPDGLIDCDWRASYRLTIPSTPAGRGGVQSWVTGVYLARLTTAGPNVRDSYILFVVRAAPAARDFVAMLPVTTYQAYNRWGGASLYEGCDPGPRPRCDGARRADRVSFNRPYGPSRSPAARFGLGAGEFITNVQTVDDDYPISSAGFDINMVRWIERQGYDVSYATSLDLHHGPDRDWTARALLSLGHDEYYSYAMWNRLHRLLDDGVNIGFFSANQIYWQVRFGDPPSGAAEHDRIMTCYRLGGDPVTDDRLTTGTFRALGRPEAEIIGSQYVADPIDSYVAVRDPDHWLMTGTGATRGMRLEGLLGYEVNALDAASPRTVKVLAHTDNGGWSSDVTYYLRPSGAQVFATGTMQWSWGLDDFVSNHTRRALAHPVVEQLTRNVMAALSDRGLVTLTAARPGLILSVPDSADAGPLRLTAPAAASGPAGLFRLVTAAPSTVRRIVARANGLCLTRRAEAAALDWRDCTSDADQTWRLIPRGASATAIASADGRLCLTASQGTAGAPPPTLTPCSGRRDQRWHIAGRDGPVARQGDARAGR